MKIPVRVKTHSVIKSVGDTESYVTSSVGEGEMEYTEALASFDYRTADEGEELITRISASAECVRLKMRGTTQADLYFRRGAEYDTVYGVGGFSFDAHVVAEAPIVRITERGGEIRLRYTMNLGGDERAATVLVSVYRLD